jgi:hypothetical protein
MANKKSAKELQDAINKSIKDLETTPPPVVPEPKTELPDPKPSEPAPSEPIPSEPAPSEPAPSEPAPSPAPAPAPAATPAQPDENNFKKKFVESSREGIVLHSKLNKVTGVIKNAINAPEPTDDEMRAAYANWDTMDEDMQSLAKDNLKNKRALAGLVDITKESEEIEAWNTKVDGYADDPKTVVVYPELEGKIDDFKIFASKPTRRGVDLDTLVSAFLHDASKMNKPKTKNQMFPTGVNGPKAPVKIKSDKLTVEQGIALKESNYKKYREMLVAGKIETPVI